MFAKALLSVKERSNGVIRIQKLKKDYKDAQKECRNLLHQKFRTNFNSEQLKQAQQRLEEAYQQLNQLTGRFKRRY